MTSVMGLMDSKVVVKLASMSDKLDKCNTNLAKRNKRTFINNPL